MEKRRIKITECPRDAMQGIKTFIPTEEKIQYLNLLLQCGFDRLDFGSFVSPKSIPQLRDTAEVLNQLTLNKTQTDLLAIVANKRGAEEACLFDEIKFLGFPFSVSETFQRRNANSTIEESLIRVNEILDLAAKHNKKLLIYLSMAFGNPYGDKWDSDLVTHWANKMHQMGVQHIALADTTGVSDNDTINKLFKTIIPSLPDCEITAHLHALPHQIKEKAITALNAGCNSFDGAIHGIGGCPMASDELTGNMDTVLLIETILSENCLIQLDSNRFLTAIKYARDFFVKFNH